MIIPTPDAVLQTQVTLLKERLLLFLARPNAYLELIENGLRFQNSVEVANKAALAKLGMISLELFQAMISGGSEYRLEGIQHLWDRLSAAGIVHKMFGHLPGAFADHVLDRFKLQQHLADETFDNLFWPPAWLLPRYGSSVVSIDVDKEGETRRGSGFILQLDRPFLVTCRHNVDPADNIVVKAITLASGAPLGVPDFVLHDRFDLAVSCLENRLSGPLLRPGPRPLVFDTTYTLGYPSVPMASAGLVGHKGEFNGAADLYMSHCPVLLISNLVSPGSSGGPVLSADGHCLGMTIQWLEAFYGESAARFSAALPIDAIVAFAQGQGATKAPN